MSERDRKHYQLIKSDPARYAAYLERKRRERKARPEYESARKKHWRDENSEANRMLRQAHHAVESAVKSGRLVRPGKCQECRRFGPVQAHHENYHPDHWLDVRWLCALCHALADRSRSGDEL